MTPQTQFTFDGQGVVLANRKDVVCRDAHPDYVNLVISAPSLYAALQAVLRDLENPEEIRPRSRHTLSLATQQMVREALDLGSSTSR